MTDLARAAARAELELWSGQLGYSIAEEEAVDATDLSPLAKQARIVMIAMEIGTATSLSEGQVRRRLSVAKDVHDRAPQTRLAFRKGQVDAARVTIISDAIYHRVPHPAGPTSGRNLWSLCRRHHQLKGRQVLQGTLPSGRVVPAERVAHSPPIPEASHAEHRLAHFIIE